MALSDRRLKRLYRHFNRRYFDGALPDSTEVWWEHVDGACADCDVDNCGLAFDAGSDSFMIRLNPDIGWSERNAKLALLHEMVHVKLYPNFNHGRRFQNEMIRLAALGAFDRLW